jgi:hypothetical protein
LVAEYEKRSDSLENSLINLSIHSGIPYTDIKWMNLKQRKMLHKEIQIKLDQQSGKKGSAML